MILAEAANAFRLGIVFLFRRQTQRGPQRFLRAALAGEELLLENEFFDPYRHRYDSERRVSGSDTTVCTVALADRPLCIPLD